MSFHQHSFQRRFATMGDIAERKFEELHPHAHRLGLNRPKFFMGGMPLAMRQTPDFMLRDRIVECMGVGRDRKLKLKTDKVEALQTWQHIGPVTLFVYDSHCDEWYEAGVKEWVEQVRLHGIARTFENDGKSFIELNVKHFPTDPQPFPDTETEAA